MASSGPDFASFSYRVETPAGSVVVTGDTPFSQGLVDFAENADIVVSEIGLVPPELVGIPLFDNVFSTHILPDEVADVANSAGSDSILMLTHFIISPPATEFFGFTFDEITSCSYVDAVVAGGFDRRIIAGNDLDTVILTGQSATLCREGRPCRKLVATRAQRKGLCQQADR